MKWGVCLFVVACTLGVKFSQCQVNGGYGPSFGRGQVMGQVRGGERGQVQVEGRGRGGQGEGRPVFGEPHVPRWKRSLRTVTVQETASSTNISGTQLITLTSSDSLLMNDNVTSATTIYHYVDGSLIEVINPNVADIPCLLIESQLPYDALISELKSRNESNSHLLPPDQKSLYATGPILDDVSKTQLFKKSDAVRVLCTGKNVVQTNVTAPPGKPEGNTQEINVLTLEKEFTFIARK